jgi:hypothetical protein
LGGGSARHKSATYIEHRINANMHASSGIRTRDSSVRAGEDNSCLRPRGHREPQARYTVEEILHYSKWIQRFYGSHNIMSHILLESVQFVYVLTLGNSDLKHKTTRPRY